MSINSEETIEIREKSVERGAKLIAFEMFKFK